MTRTYTETVILQEEVCISCGMTYAVPKHWIEMKQRTGDWFYCPNGHQQHFSETTESRLQKELQAEQKRIQALEMQLTSTNDQLQATKRELQRHKKRTANGVCPCCNRAFAQLQRHMQTKHPEYVGEKRPAPAEIDLKINKRAAGK